MIICVCKRVSEKKILNVIQDGAGTVDQVTQGCGAGGDCGACRRMIGEMILEHHCSENGDCLRAAELADRRAA
jgi:bacterioferritin-associated ferredoxin